MKNVKKDNEEDIDDDVSFENEDVVNNEERSVDKVRQLREELKQSKLTCQEYLTGWQKERAEGVNHRKRLEEESQLMRKLANERLIEDILPIIDSFDMAMMNTNVWESVDESWRKGIEYIRSQLHNVLADYGVKKIEQQEIFDPQLHESLEIIDTPHEEEDEKIDRVLQTGYMLHDRVLRPSKVVVKRITS